jgi:hypothetical protein
VPGFNHVMKNNLGYSARSTEVSNLGTSNDVTFNYFTLPVTVAAADFMSLNTSLLTLPRRPNGDLPYIAFAQLVSDSDLVDAGTNIGFTLAGAAPDLGAFEYNLEPPPGLALAVVGSNLILTGSGGPAGGTNYLLTAGSLDLPLPAWTRLTTNKFDSSGSCSVTNVVVPAVPSAFYRLQLP